MWGWFARVGFVASGLAIAAGVAWRSKANPEALAAGGQGAFCNEIVDGCCPCSPSLSSSIECQEELVAVLSIVLEMGDHGLRAV